MRRPGDAVMGLAALAVAYVAAAIGGLALASVHVSASPVWPPTGLAIAAVLVLGARCWPAIAVGAFAANWWTTGDLTSSLGIAAGNTLEAVAAGWLVRRFAGGADAFARPAGVFAFAGLAGLLATTISATIGACSLWAAGLLAAEAAPAVWLTWWLGDAAGAVIVCPPLVLWWRDRRPRPIDRSLVEAGALAAALAAVALIVFSERMSGLPIEHLCLPPLLWAALRFAPRDASTAVLLVAAIALAATMNGIGPFSHAGPNTSLLLLQAFLGVAAVTTLAVAAVAELRRRLVGELARHAEELARSNRELEHFAYAASHDLQEPLRMITSFSELVHRRHASGLDGEGKAHLERVVAAAMRMTGMLAGLLEYARIGHERASERVDLDAALDDALANLEPATREAGATIARDRLPIVVGDRGQLVRLLQNLVGNAIKFRREGAPPRIHVACARAGREWRVSVRDEGVGIPEDEAENLFRMFSRGASASHRAGSGVGLALCKKIVEGHGGRIWCESRPGEGSTFCFTLPA